MTESIAEIVETIKAFARDRQGGRVWTHGEALDNDPDGVIARRALEEFPDEDAISGAQLVLLKELWLELRQDIDDDFARFGLDAAPDPLIVAAPTGSLNACSIVDASGAAALVFDVELIGTVDLVVIELSKLVFREFGEAFVAVGSPHDSFLLLEIERAKAGIDSPILWIARQILNWVRPDVPVLGDLKHMMRAAEMVPDSNFFFDLARSYKKFLIGHEYAHYHYKHHQLLRDARAGAWTEEEIVRLRHKFECDADLFGFKSAILRYGKNAKSDPGSLVVSSFGSLSFFFIADAVEEIAAFLDSLARKPADQPLLREWVGEAINEGRERQSSATHPSALYRLLALSASVSEGSGNPRLLWESPTCKVLKTIFDCAMACAIRAIFDNSEHFKGLRPAGSDALDETFHLRMI